MRAQAILQPLKLLFFCRILAKACYGVCERHQEMALVNGMCKTAKCNWCDSWGKSRDKAINAFLSSEATCCTQTASRAGCEHRGLPHATRHHGVRGKHSKGPGSHSQAHAAGAVSGEGSALHTAALPTLLSCTEDPSD